MIDRNVGFEEYYEAEGLNEQEKLLLVGLVCGIKSTSALHSHLVYVEDVESHKILWMSNIHACIACPKTLKAPYYFKDLSIYRDKAERERVDVLDSEALHFIKAESPHALSAYEARSNAFVRIRDTCLVYDRVVRVLPGVYSLSPRFRVCKLSVSTHSELRELKVYKDGETHYYKYTFACSSWERKACLQLSVREQMILLLSVKGATEREVASFLYLSLARLKSIKGEMFRRLHVKNITQAIERALAYGLITFKQSEYEK